MRTIEKKVWPEYFQSIYDGSKHFELRLADFECEEGDELFLREWDPKSKSYTGRELRKKVTYVLRTKETNFFSPEEIEKYGYQIISFK